VTKDLAEAGLTETLTGILQKVVDTDVNMVVRREKKPRRLSSRYVGEFGP
jgi:hypothetical protein